MISETLDGADAILSRFEQTIPEKNGAVYPFLRYEVLFFVEAKCSLLLLSNGVKRVST